MRLLKHHRGRTVHVYLEGVTFEGVLDAVAGDSVALVGARVVTDSGSADLAGPVVIAQASIVWAAVIP